MLSVFCVYVDEVCPSGEVRNLMSTCAIARNEHGAKRDVLKRTRSLGVRSRDISMVVYVGPVDEAFYVEVDDCPF